MDISVRRRKKKKLNIILPLILLAIGICTYIVFFNPFKKHQDEDFPKEEVIQESENEDIQEEEILPQGPHFEELLPLIEEQQAYIVVPTNMNEKNPPTLVIYSHGSNTTVTQNIEEQFMKDLQEYGISLTLNNYIFSASNQHGVNWGNTASIQDTLNLQKWIEERYKIQPKIYLIGYSMGGLPTLNFATTYPENIDKIALLAPTTKSAEWNQERANKLKSMNIKLWHGNKDVNVPYSYSVSFVKKLEGYGVYIDFVTLDGKGHFDIDTEYMEDILEFFNN